MEELYDRLIDAFDRPMAWMRRHWLIVWVVSGIITFLIVAIADLLNA